MQESSGQPHIDQYRSDLINFSLSLFRAIHEIIFINILDFLQKNLTTSDFICLGSRNYGMFANYPNL